MGRKRLSQELVVSVNGSEVGRLERVTRGELRFGYAASWIASERATPISLSMPCSAEPWVGDVVWSFFDNLLPEDPETRRRLAQVLGAESTRPFDLLAVAGRDCVGALRLAEPDAPPETRRIEATPVSGEWIAARLRDWRRRPLGVGPDEDFRISIAGVQAKTALLRMHGGWHLPHGATPTTHILKQPIGAAPQGIDLADSVENEWPCLRVARAFGLPVPAAEVLELDGLRVLCVERFDRRWTDDGAWLLRLPQEDACQALAVPPVRKYEADGGPGIAAVLDLLLQSREPAEDRRTLFRAAIVYWLLAAIDGHAKTFSVFLLPGGRCRMTPLYDVLSAYPLVARGQLAAQELSMAMAVVGKNRHYRWSDIRRRHWASTARAARFPEREAQALLDECLERVPAVVAEVAGELPPAFPSAVAEPILDGLSAMRTRV